jgi:DNA-binding transcriptional ArsR family regulator
MIKMSGTNNSTIDLEEEIFKTLSHQLRRDILRYIGEKKEAKFTEIKSATGIEESASLSYHLKELSPLLKHEEDIYSLSDLGEDIYSLMNKLTTYSSSVTMLEIINKKLGATIIANGLIWISAIGYMSVVEGPLEFMTYVIFLVLFTISNIILFSTSRQIKL